MLVSGTSAVGHQIQIPVAGDLEQVRFELRQVARAGQRRRVRHERRLDFRVAVLRACAAESMKLISARASRAPAPMSTEKRAAGDLRAALEVDDAERRTEVPVRLRREGERRAACRDGGPRRCPPRSSPPARWRAAGSGITSKPAVPPLFDACRARASSCLIRCARARLASWIVVVSRPWPLRAGDFLRRRRSARASVPRARAAGGGGSLRARRVPRARRCESRAAILQRRCERRRGCHGETRDRASIGLRRFYLRYDCTHGADRSAKPSSLPRASARDSCPPPRRSPKEMLVLVDKPVIQYGVEEAVASGVDNIVIVTGRGKNAIEDHFDVAFELESFLEQRGKKEQLDEIREDRADDQSVLRAPGRAARPRPRRARRQESGRQRAVRRHSRRRCDRCESAGVASR